MTVPAFGDVNVTVHSPALVPGLAHVSLDTSFSDPSVSVRSTSTGVPSGAAVQPSTPSPSLAGRPSSWKTAIVNVCGSPTVLVSSGGLIVMYASTQVLVFSTTSAP